MILKQMYFQLIIYPCAYIAHTVNKWAVNILCGNWGVCTVMGCPLHSYCTWSLFTSLGLSRDIFGLYYCHYEKEWKWLHFLSVPAIPVKAPTRKSAPGRVHGKNPQKCAHGPVFCISEVTHAGSVPNNPPMGQLLGETMVSITCVINTLSGTWRSNEGATYYFTKYCCVK